MIMYHFSYKNFNFLDKLSENTEFAYKFAAGREGAKTKKRIEFKMLKMSMSMMSPASFRLPTDHTFPFLYKEIFLKS